MASANVKRVVPQIGSWGDGVKKKRPPCITGPEICKRYGITQAQLRGYLSQHPLQAEMNLGAKRLAYYALPAVEAWAKNVLTA